jgi:hypothetical protein
MKIPHARLRYLLPLFLGAFGLFGLLYAWPETAGRSAHASSKNEEPPTVTPASRLVLRVGTHKGEVKELLDSSSAVWEKAATTRIVLNRTPRIYQTEPRVETPPPALEVRSLRADGKLVLRLQWADATRDAPQAPARKTGEGGDPDKLYKRPTGETATFADAAAVMVPERWTGTAFPSLVMGDKHVPARIYYWNASRGAEELIATGRATQESSGKSVAHRAGHADGRWTVTMEVPEPSEGYPIAFAIWDGHSGDRDGLKFFSIWYVLKWQ